MAHLRWIICLATSLLLHVTYLNGAKWIRIPQGRPPARSLTIAPTPAEPIRRQSVVREAVPEEPDLHAGDIAPDRFRPNIEQTDEAQEKQQPPEPQKPEQLAEQMPAAQMEALLAEPAEREVLTRQDAQQKIAQYREQLLQDFQDDWQKVPPLNTMIADLTQLPLIDRHFGITILAYGFADNKPAAPFFLYDARTETFQELAQFDFSSYSNRIKDRMLARTLRDRLEAVRRDSRIGSLMKIIGLVPTQADRYFAAKQLRAAQLASVKLDAVSATNGHYASDGFDGFNLIIDSVQTDDGRTIPIRDEELEYSVVAKN